MGSVLSYIVQRPLIEINYKTPNMLGSHDEQYTKAEWEIIDVMCEESSEKTYCSV